MKRFFKFLGITTLILLIGGGAAIYIFRAKILSHYIPEVDQIGDIQISIKNDTSYISSQLTIRNKTFLKITIDTIKYKVTLFNTTYMQSETFLGIILPGEGMDTIDFAVKIPYASIMKELSKQRSKGDSTSYSLDVSLQYSTAFGKAEFPFIKSAKIKIPQPPELEIVSIDYTKVRRKKILATARIKITNHSEVSLSISELKYNMKILKQGNLKGNFTTPIVIKPNETTYITLPIEINVNNIGKTMFQVMFNKDNYDYTLTMNAKLESKDPIDKLFQIDLIKNGKMELRK